MGEWEGRCLPRSGSAGTCPAPGRAGQADEPGRAGHVPGEARTADATRLGRTVHVHAGARKAGKPERTDPVLAAVVQPDAGGWWRAGGLGDPGGRPRLSSPRGQSADLGNRDCGGEQRLLPAGPRRRRRRPHLRRHLRLHAEKARGRYGRRGLGLRQGRGVRSRRGAHQQPVGHPGRRVPVGHGGLVGQPAAASRDRRGLPAVCLPRRSSTTTASPASTLHRTASTSSRASKACG